MWEATFSFSFFFFYVTAKFYWHKWWIKFGTQAMVCQISYYLLPGKPFQRFLFPWRPGMHQKGEPCSLLQGWGYTVGRDGLCPSGGRLTGPQHTANSLSMGQRHLLSQLVNFILTTWGKSPPLPPAFPTSTLIRFSLTLLNRERKGPPLSVCRHWERMEKSPGV